MRWFKNSHTRNIYFASGVEDYLTDSAKKHRRNLMYASFVVLVLSIFNLDIIPVPAKEFSSLFGFKLVDSSAAQQSHEVNSLSTGIPFTVVIGFMSLVSFWETIMLFSYQKLCESHWFGDSVTKGIDENGKKELKKFEEIELISYEFENSDALMQAIQQAIDSSNSLLSQAHMQFRGELKDSAMILQETDEETRGIINKYDVTESELIENRVDRFQKEVERKIDHLKRTLEKNAIDRLDNIIRANEEWKVYIEHQAQSNINTYQKLFNQLNKVARPNTRVQLAEFYLPLAFGVVACFLGAYQILVNY
ncbi:hypothetical protein [Vibrio splendidus]|uniref:hypothetical protein n=1 Tax=Vibrio splendidus TaxID=29497 RepID=UPI0024698DE5|nr:hypothetical protein [Vibrio splendidus]MDH5915067.1 hypothetical protein [Vibrio splendidus]